MNAKDFNTILNTVVMKGNCVELGEDYAIYKKGGDTLKLQYQGYQRTLTHNGIMYQNYRNSDDVMQLTIKNPCRIHGRKTKGA